MAPRKIKLKISRESRLSEDLPVSLIASTVFHFAFLFFLVSQGIFSVSAAKDVFVKVRIVELPAGFGGALSGTPGGKVDSQSPPLKKDNPEPPKTSLPDKNKKEESGKSPVKNPDPEGKAVGLGGEGRAGLGGKNRGLLLDAQDFEYEWYKARLEDALKANWKKPYTKKKYASSVHFVIETTGSVKEVQIVKSSGEIDFDKSVVKAVYDSQPFPKFPPQYTSPSLGVLYTFELEPGN
jgi:TonB family protein